MRRPPLAGLALPLLLVLFAPPAEALAVTGSFNLGKVDPGSSFQLPVVLDNTQNSTEDYAGTYSTSVNIAQGYTAAEEAAVPSWIRPPATTWSVAQGQNVTFAVGLAVPPAAHSGPYLLLANFLETQRANPASGRVVSVAINHAVGVSFTVRGVDVIGRVAVPATLRPNQTLGEITLAVGNYLSTNVTGHPVQEVWHEGRVVRTFAFPDREIPLSPAFPTSAFAYTPDFRGVPLGEHTLRSYVEYRIGNNSTLQQSRPKEQLLVIGEQNLTATGHAVVTPLGRFNLSQGGRLELPRRTTPSLEFHVANLGNLLATADLRLVVQRRGAENQTVERAFPVAGGTVVSASLPFELSREGLYDLRLEEDGTPWWNATIEAKAPQVDVDGPTLRRDVLTFGLANRGVIVRACYLVDVQTAFAQPVPGRNATQDCRIQPHNDTWPSRVRLNVSGLPDGAYQARLTADWTGTDNATVRDVAFTLPLPAQGPPGLEWLKRNWPILVGGASILLALFYARKFRRKEDQA